MLANALRDMRQSSLFDPVDARNIPPTGGATIKRFNLPFLSDNELLKEAGEPDFWAEADPNICKLKEPHIAFCKLLSSENDDLIRPVVAYFFERRRHTITARVKNVLDSPHKNWRDCSSDISDQSYFL